MFFPEPCFPRGIVATLLRMFSLIAMLLMACTTFLYGTSKPSPIVLAPQVSRATMDRAESFRVSIENKTLGRVMVSLDKGRNWTLLGTVLAPISALREIHDAEFTASDWGYVGAVTATAVNAIHVKVAHPGKHALIFSLLPAELYDPKGFQTSYRDNPSSIFLDIPAGTGLFGGDWGFRLGDPLYGIHEGAWVPWPEDKVPVVGDVLGFISKVAPDFQWMIEIENIKNGTVLFATANGTPVPIARVIQPFGGSGRFLGTLFQDVGKIRANHPGVIDISSSPIGEQGGVQIVPFFHSKEPNLAYVHSSPAYMVIAAFEDRLALEGQAPLFMDYIRPGDTVLARVAGEWVPFPKSSGKDLLGLTQVEAIRIMPGSE